MPYANGRRARIRFRVIRCRFMRVSNPVPGVRICEDRQPCCHPEFLREAVRRLLQVFGYFSRPSHRICGCVLVANQVVEFVY